jgi:predicted unusual protein kinase regulating ubiquinone biosynthesis (AarF/ABC1/UbiB family)
VQHPGVAAAVEGDLRDLGLVAPLVKRLAPGLDAGALLSEMRERISDELDYELEAQHQRRLERITSVYLQGIDSGEIIETVHARRAPMIPVSASLRL